MALGLVEKIKKSEQKTSKCVFLLKMTEKLMIFSLFEDNQSVHLHALNSVLEAYMMTHKDLTIIEHIHCFLYASSDTFASNPDTAFQKIFRKRNELIFSF